MGACRNLASRRGLFVCMLLGRGLKWCVVARVFISVPEPLLVNDDGDDVTKRWMFSFEVVAGASTAKPN